MKQSLRWVPSVLSAMPPRVRLQVGVGAALVVGLFSILIWEAYNNGSLTSLLSVVISIGLLIAFVWIIVPQFSIIGESNVWTGYAGVPDLNHVLITIDDAPSATTSAFLDILDQHGIKALFFVLGHNTAEHPTALDDIIRRGRAIGSHGYSHSRYPLRSRSFILTDVEKSLTTLHAHLSSRVPLFRAPHGFRSPFLAGTLERLNLRHLSWQRGFWDTDAGVTAQQLIDRAKRVRGGEILLFHDAVGTDTSADRTAILTALPQMIAIIRRRGLAFEDPHTFCNQMSLAK